MPPPTRAVAVVGSLSRVSSTDAIPVCYRHPDRQTRLSCSSCGRPICTDCVRPASVGQLCPDCVAERGQQRVVRAEQLGAQQRRPTPVTYGILIACVAIMAVSVVSPAFEELAFLFGAQFNRGIAAGQWWRVVTAGFLHADLAHILFNMWALYVLGPHLERQAGSAAFASLYGASLIAGGTAFYLLNPEGVAVGASGAIFGLFGAWLAVAYRNRNSAFGRSGLNQLLLLLGINLALPLFIPRIAWQAHLGGLLAGLLIAAVWTMPALRGRGRRGARVAVGVAVAVAALSAVVLA